jgi:hypothetical protein
MSEYRAERFAELVKEGRVIVGVLTATEPEARNVREILEHHGGTLMAETA